MNSAYLDAATAWGVSGCVGVDVSVRVGENGLMKLLGVGGNGLLEVWGETGDLFIVLPFGWYNYNERSSMESLPRKGC
jgi:hypothetical protein